MHVHTVALLTLCNSVHLELLDNVQVRITHVLACLVPALRLPVLQQLHMSELQSSAAIVIIDRSRYAAVDCVLLLLLTDLVLLIMYMMLCTAILGRQCAERP
jgi:hypothetical protein